ncbi:hypothetical protein SAMN05661080_02904 [Modestobacter sp. DSM 44400]|uniref:hypothetical protein n=1 Tax=Modestobacter sp. DSM 44400 TaxID=1550230 RepID=UPI00089C472B|nr:hypothetical protein [Modestobacter sp. DSM 44400]SDY26560.1 hypothetical protein SAMN05661080_02904 [Modestobacter sp. DSM 44400]
MTDPFEKARENLAADALLRRADAVPGAEIEAAAGRVVEAVKALRLARDQLRVAQNPEMDPTDAPGRDAAYLAQRREEYQLARAWLRATPLPILQKRSRSTRRATSDR